jgi:hypothetical protein
MSDPERPRPVRQRILQATRVLETVAKFMVLPTLASLVLNLQALDNRIDMALNVFPLNSGSSG